MKKITLTHRIWTKRKKKTQIQSINNNNSNYISRYFHLFTHFRLIQCSFLFVQKQKTIFAFHFVWIFFVFLSFYLFLRLTKYLFNIYCVLSRHEIRQFFFLFVEFSFLFLHSSLIFLIHLFIRFDCFFSMSCLVFYVWITMIFLFVVLIFQRQITNP